VPFLLAILWLFWAPGCAPASEGFRTNIIMVDKEGRAVDPVKPFKTLGDQYGDYVENIFSDIVCFCNMQRADEERQGQEHKPCKLLFYFHGGLNSRGSSVGRAAKLVDTIKKEGVYPIFVNWRSSLFSSWWDHVAHVRSGFWMNGTQVLAPYYAAVDEVKAISEAPKAWVAEARHAFPRQQAAGNLALATYQTMVTEYKEHKDRSMPVNDLLVKDSVPPRLLDERTQGEKWLPRGTVVLTAGTKLIGGPLVVQAGGTGGWDIMQRRTLMLFRTEAELRDVPPEAIKQERRTRDGFEQEYDTRGGAFAYFITRFQEEFLPQFCEKGTYNPAPTEEQAQPKSHEEGAGRRASCPDRLELSLVGHSMGTIIIDRLLRFAPNLEVRNIVFMGAATSVEDYRDTVDAYLDRHKGDGKPNHGPRMYHLVLHPMAESTERNFLDLAPRGSLLVWIDNYFTEPITPLGRRVGRFSNVVPELRFAEKGIRNRIHLKVFRFERKYSKWNPRKHTEFGSFPFWDERFWDPATPTNETSPVQRIDG
jgi:hypothetical protein